eukprot:s1141_g16.t1
MTTVEKRDQIVSWDGNPATWTEYVKRVRFQFEKTEPRKRRLLGAELASRLTNRAWEITAAEVDHAQLQRSDGAAYLLKFLEEKLCKAPIPDTGQRLEDMLIRLRRVPGSSMTEWATQVRETYRRLQRAMARQRRDSDLRKAQLGYPGTSAPVLEHSPGSQRRRSDVTSPARHRPHTPTGSQHFGNDDDEFNPNPEPDGDPGQEHGAEPNPDGYQPVATSDVGSNPGHDERWTQEQWDEWRAQRRRWRHRQSDTSTTASWDDTEDVKVQWEQFDYGEMQILPEEILGWILLRRSGLPASARLSILFAINNCLDFSVMERAMRDQEEELLMTEAQRSHGALQRPRRSFWVESDGQCGLLAETELDEINENSIHWVGDHLPSEVYAAAFPEPGDDEQAWVTQLPNGHELEWQWYDDDFYAMDADGCFWSWAETKTWLDVEECMASAPADAKQFEEVYVNFQDRIRTFKESRTLNTAKHLSRGYYPLNMMKGKTKGKGKGKNPRWGGKKGTSSNPAQALMNSKGGNLSSAVHSNGPQRPGNPGYKGCFVCGSREHDFRSCPKRQQPTAPSSSPSRAAHYANSVLNATIYMVTDEAENLAGISDETIPVSAEALAVLAQEYPGHAVIDSGATESIASLEALDEIMQLRSERFVGEEIVVHEQKKRFRFGNGEMKCAESFVELPQLLSGHPVKLGVHAMDAPGVPLLISVKTLTRLHAVVDFSTAEICFKSISDKIWIPLKRAKNGHLLLNLTQDWFHDKSNVPHTEVSHVSDDMESRVQYKGAMKPNEVERSVERRSDEVEVGYIPEQNEAAGPPTAAAKEKPKAKPKTAASRKTREPSSERYDWSRAEYANPQDPRSQGFPCWGQHQPQKEGRGSLSGRNGHAKWEVCSVCKLRTLYVPTHGSKGIYRSAGPLPADAARALDKVKDTVLSVPEERETLTTKAVGISGAKESLLKKLQKLENEEKNLQAKTSAPATASTTPTPKTVTETTKKATKRDQETTPEKLEEETEGWVDVKD